MNKQLTCQWRTLCPRPAYLERTHPLHGRVAVCVPCAQLADRVDAYVRAYVERYGVAPSRFVDFDPVAA